MKIATRLELPKPTNEVLETTRAGLAAWDGVSDMDIVATLPQWVDDVFDSPQLTNLGLLPSVELSPLSGRYGLDSHKTWRQYADAVDLACRLTGSPIAMLHMESARKYWLDGDDDSQLDHISAEVERCMPPRWRYVLYPTVWGTQEQRAPRYQFADAIAGALVDVEFTSYEYNRPSDVGRTAADASAAMMDALELTHSCSEAQRWQIIYLHPVRAGSHFWQYGGGADPRRHFTRALELLGPNDIACLNPGWDNWPDSQIIVDELRAWKRKG